MNETVRFYCQEAGVEFTRCRPYRKNDQAWVEQKNGAVVRRIVGYRRYMGLEAAATLGSLYASVRLFVNFFQPSFKLAEKIRHGAKVTKRYHPPVPPYQRLLADPRTSEEVRCRVSALHASLDPVRLLSEIRLAQRQLVEIADRPTTGDALAPSAPTLAQFLLGLRTSWQEAHDSPHFSDRPENVCEERLLVQHAGEALHQWTQPGFRHHGDQVVEHAALAEQRVDAALGRVGLEHPIIAQRFARGAEQRQEHHRKGVDQP